MWNSYFSERCDLITQWKARFPDFNFNRRDCRAGVTALSLVVQFGVGPDMEARSRDHMVRGVSRAVDKIKALIAAGASLDVRMHTGSHIMIQVRKRREGLLLHVGYTIIPSLLQKPKCITFSAPFTDSLHYLLTCQAGANKDDDGSILQYLLTLPAARRWVNVPMRPRTWKWTAITVIARVMIQCGSKNSLLKAVSSWSKLTSLGSAARSGNTALLEALVNNGKADVRQKNSQGHNALDHVRISTGMVTDKHISLLSAPPVTASD